MTSTYVRKLLPVVAVLLLPFATAVGQVVYTDVNPDSTVATAPSQAITSYRLDLDNNKSYEYELSYFVSGTEGKVQLAPHSVGAQETLLGADGLTRPLSSYDTAGQKSIEWGLDTWAILNDTWYDGADKYIGIRFKIKGKWHYGWARIFVPTDRSSFIIKDYAYNLTPDEPILAGQTTTAGVTTNAIGEQTRISVSPNPVTTSATIRCTAPQQNARLIIFTTFGQKIKELPVTSERELLLDRAGMANGVYLLQLLQGNSIIATTRIIIQD